MRLSRARYVTVCQQSLVTAVVLVVAASAAGVRTLDIVPTPGGGSAGASAAVPAEVLQRDAEPQQAPQEAVVATEPARPKVREFEVAEAPAPAAPAAAKRSSGARSAAPQEPARTAAPAEVSGHRVVAQSAPEPVRGFGTVGVTWKGAADGSQYADDDIAVEVRTSTDGAWTDWAPVEYHDAHGPDAEEAARAQERAGTEPVVVGDVDEVQVRAATADGEAPSDLQLAVIDPGTAPTAVEQPALETTAPAALEEEPAAQEPGAGGADDTVELSAARRAVAKPTIYSRAQWGANEKLRDGSPSYGTIKTGFIHHTVNANDYTEAQVPSLLRGIYAYHTQSRGWSDIGYNFLVDRFGRIWEGRYGGVDKAVVGAHTSGYNSSSFAMSAIGNFDVAAPPQAVVDAYSRLFAWKLSLAGVRADATGITLGSKTFRGINGHRDAGSTACPGRYLYAKLPVIRTAATKIQDGAGFTEPTPPPSTAPTPTPAPAPAPAPAPTDPTVAPLVALTSPTQAPQTWSSQRAGLSFPAARSIVGSAAPDLVAKRSDGRVVVVPTGGRTGFGEVRSNGSWQAKNVMTAVGDVTGDRVGDVVTRGRDRVLRVHAGRTDGRVGPAGRALRPAAAFRTARSVVSAGDWNRDGRADLLVVTASRKLVVFLGTGRLSFRPGPTLARSWSYGSTAVVGDLTGDRRNDVVAVSAGRLDVFAGKARGLSKRVSSVRPEGGITRVLGATGAASDLTGDRRADVVAVSGGSVRVLPGTGSGGRLRSAWGPYALPSGVAPVSVGQLGGTRQGDLLGVSGSQLVVGLHNGASDTLPAIATNVLVPGASQVLSAGDWNGDGRGDLITRENDRDRLVLRLGNGAGRFGAPVVLGNGWANVLRLAAVGDVTGDGRPDLVGVRRNGMTVVYPGKPGGLYGPVTAPATLAGFGVVGSGAWSPTNNAQRLSNADGSFVPAGGGIPSLAAYDLVGGPGDVDGDGVADLVVRERTTGRLFLLPGTGTGLGERRYLGTDLPGYTAIGG